MVKHKSIKRISEDRLLRHFILAIKGFPAKAQQLTNSEINKENNCFMLHTKQ